MDGRSATVPAAWSRILWTGAVAASAAGAAAWALEGVARRTALLVLYVSALAMGAATSRRFVKETPDAPERYTPPVDARLRLVHTAVTLLYTMGIIVTVFAASVRFGLVPTAVDRAVVQAFPVTVGLYVLLLATAAWTRIREQDGVVHATYTRVHGWILAFVGAAILLLGIVFLFRSSVPLGGLVLQSRDLVVLYLVGVLGVGTHIMLAARLPTTIDLVRRVFRPAPRRPAHRLQETPPVLYAVLGALAATLVIGFLADVTGVLRGPGALATDRVVQLLALLMVGLVAFVAISALSIRREARTPLHQRRIPTGRRNAILVFGLAGVLGLLFGGLATAHYLGRLESIGPFSGAGLRKDLVTLFILGTTGPIGVYLHRRNRKIQGIESHLPDFLNDLAENRRAGLTLPASLMSAAQADYGELTADVRHMAHQVAWGVAFNDALLRFAARVPSALVKRTAHLIVEASRTGGSVAEILRAAAHDAYELKALEAERRITMMTYLIVLYVVFFVFLVVVSVLDVKFIPEVLAANQAARDAEAQGVEFINIDADQLQFVYFHAAIVQSIGNGLVGGTLAEGRVSAGFRHVALMTLIAWILFRLVLPAA